MEDDFLSLVPFKLALIIITHDFKNIYTSLTPTIVGVYTIAALARIKLI
jgi:hypothetical protein